MQFLKNFRESRKTEKLTMRFEQKSQKAPLKGSLTMRGGYITPLYTVSLKNTDLNFTYEEYV